MEIFLFKHQDLLLRNFFQNIELVGVEILGKDVVMVGARCGRGDWKTELIFAERNLSRTVIGGKSRVEV